MWQELPAGHKVVWENVTEERVREQLGQMVQPSDPDVERKMIGMMRGDIERGPYGYFRYWPDDKSGNPSL